MKVSVILPTYKPGAYIDECIASLVAQDMPKSDWELVVVVNGCCEPYCTRITKLLVGTGVQSQLLQTDRGGVSNARNMGMAAARGEYFAFVDDDDYVSPAYLSELYACVTPCCVSFSATTAFFDDTKAVCPDYYIAKDYARLTAGGRQEYNSLYAVRRYLNGPCMKMLHKDVVAGRRFNTTLANGEDSVFMFSVSDRIATMRFTSPSAMYYRRVRTKSATSNCDNRSYRWRNGVRLMWNFFKVYARGPFRYSLPLFVSRLLAVAKTALATSSTPI